MDRAVLNFAVEILERKNLPVRGLLFVDLGKRGAEIYLKKDAQRSRKRFTLAHELGHFMLREHVEQSVGHRNSKRQHNSIEQWCNTFAANLLMPREVVLDYFRQNGLSKLLSSFEFGPRHFEVSNQAFRMRAAEVAPMSIYVFDVDEPPKLREFFLSQVSDIRWSDSLDNVMAKWRQYLVKPFLHKFGLLTIICGCVNSSQRKELLIILMQSRS